MDNHCEISWRWSPHVTVASIAMRDGKYLMVKEFNQGQIVINQPAGHLEKDETLERAVIRETREETGWDFEPECMIGIYYFEAENGESYLRFTFQGRLTGHRTNEKLDPAIEEVVWLNRESLEQVVETLRSDIVLQCINDFESG